MPSTVPSTSSREPQETETAPTVDLQTDQQQNSGPALPDEPAIEADISSREQADVHHDDGGEVMEDNEDTVIY